jgi:signal transduction histidine kinase
LGDELLLGQLFQNLIGNALKFHGAAPPQVVISAHRLDGHWEFAVRDNGIGIPAEHQARVFELFQRLNPPEKFAGSGIGLATCRKIVERHGGRIWVESPAGPGTVFRFTLPATP